MKRPSPPPMPESFTPSRRKRALSEEERALWDSVAKQITRLMGSRVSMTYQEHRGIPGTCFGETNYFVTGAQVVP